MTCTTKSARQAPLAKEKADGRDPSSAYAKREAGSRYVPQNHAGLLDQQHFIQLLLSTYQFP
jgi:hypothetical protein